MWTFPWQAATWLIWRRPAWCTANATRTTAAVIRERGRYSGYLGAVFALATVSGPLIGGVIVDTPGLGWRWTFYVGVPFAAAAIVILQKILHLPTVKRDNVRIDWLGATVIVGAVSLLLVWVSLVGNDFAWLSVQSALLVLGALALGALAVLVEHRAAEPVIPLALFRHRTIVLATVASLFVGVGLFGSTIFLSQYFQISRGDSPTKAGLMTMPLVLGLFVSSLLSGQVITRTGRWKAWLVSGALLLTAGFALLATLRVDTPYRWSRATWRSPAWAWGCRCRTWCCRCRTSPRSTSSGSPAPPSRSFAPSAARSACPHWGHCSATR